MQRPLEILAWNLRKALRDFLERLVLDPAAGQLAPPFNPAPAEMAVTIEDNERFVWWTGHPDLRHASGSALHHGTSTPRCSRAALLGANERRQSAVATGQTAPRPARDRMV